MCGGLNLKINEYSQSGNYLAALECGETAFKLLTELNNEEGLSYIYSSISTVYFYMKQEDKSLLYAHKGFSIEKRIRPPSTHGTTYANIALFHINLKKFDSAEVYLNKGLKIFIENKDTINIQNVYYNLGIADSYRNKCENALTYFKNALAFAIHLQDEVLITRCNNAIANCYFKLNNAKEGLYFIELAYNLSKKIKVISLKKEICFNYYRLLKLNNQFEKALIIHEEFVIFNDSLNNVNVRKSIVKKTMELEYAVKEATLKIEQENEKIIAEKEKKQQQIILYSVCGVLIISLFFAFFIFNGLKKQRTANKIISLQKQEVERQKHTVEEQKQLIEEHQKETIDSINYAKRIQYALLANSDLLKQNLPEHFVLFNPKDIVSGDFYWATHHENKFYLAVCDSTGHGVPGAFMSLLNMGFLSEAIKEKGIYKPNEVLNYVRKRLIESIGNDGQQDGMDAILICIDNTNNSITYSAANNEPILIRKNEIIELPKDKMPVGKGEKTESFTLQTIEVNKGDVLYLYTDGYADQFGGPKGKKFKYKALNDLLLANSAKEPNEQLQILNQSFLNWRGDLEQVDDVCIIGIKI